MLVNDANGKHLVAPGVLYVIQKYVYKKKLPEQPWVLDRPMLNRPCTRYKAGRWWTLEAAAHTEQNREGLLAEFPPPYLCILSVYTYISMASIHFLFKLLNGQRN